MKLEQAIQRIKPIMIQGDTRKEISHITFDSRKVEQGSLFIAMRGTQVDGHKFIEKAVSNGATIILGETPYSDSWGAITYLQVEDSAIALGQLADLMHASPSKNLKLVGVTGTNGKTTTTTLLYDTFTALGYKCGLISTIENRIGGNIQSSTHTTPDALSIQALLAEMVDAGCSYVFMEVSSHAIHQKRIHGLHFAGGIFTNITHDHLDYHKTFKAYIAAKKAFFDNLPKSAFALTNLDDRNGLVMIQNTKALKKTYSLRSMSGFRAKILENTLTGLHLLLDEQDFYSRLIGEFNAYNVLSVYACAMLLDQDRLEVLTALSGLKAAEGRFDYLVKEDQNIIGIVDYAHTPDALEKVLDTIIDLRAGNTRIITVVGAGGDRDKKKRPRMAVVAAERSDLTILTSDNPRTEDPAIILEDMEAGLNATQRPQVLSILDRREAIRTASKLAQNSDIILIAGKGHEKYQEINGVKHPFDDKAILAEALGLTNQ